MKFGVVLCSRCKTARGVRLNTKTATCAKCQKRMDLKRTRILCKVETEREVALAVRKYNTKLKGGEEIYARDMRIVNENKEQTRVVINETSDIYTEVVRKLIRIRARDERVVAAAQELYRYLGEFTGKDLYEVLKLLGFDKEEDCHKYIDKLIANDVIYEPKRGVYRCLEGT